MFDGFQLDRVDVGEVTLRVRYGGEGEPVVLLHPNTGTSESTATRTTVRRNRYCRADGGR